MSVEMMVEMSEETKRVLAEVNDSFESADQSCLLADGLEAGLIGWVQIFNKRVALYDRELCIQALIDGGASPDAAEESFEFNTQNAYLGDETPAFATIIRKTPG